MTPSLAERSRQFAGEVADLLEKTINCQRQIVSVKVEGDEKYVVRPGDADGHPVKIPLYVAREHLADLELVMYQVLDRTGHYLKTSKTDFRVFSTVERTPLLRLEYDSAAEVVPAAHWQFHAERGAFAHLLTIASRAGSARGPVDLSTLHLPVGGERFRPGLEDLLEFLIRECGIDGVSGWEAAVKEGRRRWRVRQLRAAVRDQQAEAVSLLRDLGWDISPRDDMVTPHESPFVTW